MSDGKNAFYATGDGKLVVFGNSSHQAQFGDGHFLTWEENGKGTKLNCRADGRKVSARELESLLAP